MSTRTRWSLLAFACALGASPLPRARACGGFFCSASPIRQAREVVVYGYEADGTLTMAVQINYSGRDEDFAWILPVPVPPDEIAVGTDALFRELLGTTEPAFTLLRETTGTCARARCTAPSYGGCGLGCASDGIPSVAADSGAFLGDGGVPDAGSVVIHSEGVVGPYDTVVLGARTAAEVIDWLRMSGYEIPAESEPLLAPYARQGFVFVALRLNAKRDSSVIRPIVLRMATGEACLPIRLTAIATTPELPIDLFFLADAQARSTNYSFVDPAADVGFWRARGGLGGSWTGSWDEDVASAVREMGGRAFATAYADGTPSVSIELPDVRAVADASSASEVLQLLADRGYQGTPLLLELLSRYIVPPRGADPQDYFNCLLLSESAGPCGGEPESFDPRGLADAIEAEITVPRREAQALVSRHPFTTRLSTRMRAEDMTIDPVFTLDRGLPDVPRVRTATLYTRCSADYFEVAAPQELEVGGALLPYREGETISEEQACHRAGLVRESSGCSAAVDSQASTFVLLTALGLLAMGFRRRRRARGA